MKNIYLIGGTMGVGKTTVSRCLRDLLPNSVFLDGDWCWDSNPFQVTDETRAMVMENICFLLNSFICCTVYENVIFCWVMHEQRIIDEILSRVNARDCNVRCISLMADEAALRERLEQDIAAGLRKSDIIERSMARLPLYSRLSTIKLDVSAITPAEAAARLAGI